MNHIIYEKYSVTLQLYYKDERIRTIKRGRKMKCRFDKMKENALIS